MYFDITTKLIFGLVWIGTCLFLRKKKKKSLTYLLFFSLFYLYLFKVLDYTLFQFQSLLFLKYFMPHLILKGQTAENTFNLVPLITLTVKDFTTSFLNILLFVPFGFGLPFISNFHLKMVIITGALFSVYIELLQLMTGLLAGITFRIVDINDVLFNTLGVVIGYILFTGFIHIFHRIYPTEKKYSNPLLNYISQLPKT